MSNFKSKLISEMDELYLEFCKENNLLDGRLSDRFSDKTNILIKMDIEVKSICNKYNIEPFSLKNKALKSLWDKAWKSGKVEKGVKGILHDL